MSRPTSPKQMVAPPSALRLQDLDLGAASVRGGRDSNEDSVALGVPQERSGIAPRLLPVVEDHAPRLWVEKGMVALVADGMGGVAGGRAASDMAVRAAERQYFESASATSRLDLEQAMDAAAREVYYLGTRSNEPRDRLPGSTLIAAVIHGEQLLVANVGDSRAYHLADGQLQQITRDHVALVAGGHMGLTRSLGMEPHVQVDYFERPFRSGDALLLCTDGLTNQLSDDEIEDLMERRSAQAAADALVAEADRRGRLHSGGRHDNITALVIRRSPARRSLHTRRRLLIAAVILALIVAAVAVAALLWPRGGPPQPAGTASVQPSSPTLALAASGTQAPSPVLAAQTDPAPSTSPVVVTLAGGMTRAPSATPTTPRPTTTPAPQPSATLTPSITPTPRESPTPRPSATAEGSATPTPSLPVSTPRWLAPLPGTTLDEHPINFRWEWDGVLGADLYFQVRVRTAENLDAPAWGLELWRFTSQNISIEPVVALADIHPGQVVWLAIAVGYPDDTGLALAEPVLAESDLRQMLWNPFVPVSSPKPEPTEKKEAP